MSDIFCHIHNHAQTFYSPSSLCSINSGGWEEFPCVAASGNLLPEAWLSESMFAFLSSSQVKCKGMRNLGLPSKKATACTYPGRIGQYVRKLLLTEECLTWFSVINISFKKKSLEVCQFKLGADLSSTSLCGSGKPAPEGHGHSHCPPHP